jgi:hypothetical protein
MLNLGAQAARLHQVASAAQNFLIIHYLMNQLLANEAAAEAAHCRRAACAPSLSPFTSA